MKKKKNRKTGGGSESVEIELRIHYLHGNKSLSSKTVYK